VTLLLTSAVLILGLIGGVILGAGWAGRRVRSVTASLYPATTLRPGNTLPDALSGLQSASATARYDAQAIKESLALIRGSMDALPFGVVVMEQGATVDWRNLVARNLLGPTRTGLVIDEAVKRQRAEALVGRTSTETIEVQGPPNRVLVVSAVPINRSEQGASGVVIIEDITARAHLEAVRKDFVANISHELRTPVGALALLAETLQDETDPEVVSRFAGKLVDESHRVARIVDDLLELSVLEGEAAKHRNEENIHDIVSDALERVRTLAESRSIALDTSAVDVDLVAPCERRQLVSAVSHLVENATKYSEVGGVVAVAAERVGDDITIRVTDAGVGIPAKEVGRIFERFYRVDPARSRNTGGTGLGLAIVRHVASNHNGDVTVESTEGVGSTFRLRLPSLVSADVVTKGSA
jgi:two-component system, OmpR family, sensor histidine kinase SenX3